MLQSVKNFLKKFIPPPTNVFHREINRILAKGEKQHADLSLLLSETGEKYSRQIEALSDLIKQTEEKNAEQLVSLSGLVKQTEEKNVKQIAALSGLVKKTDEKNVKQIASLSGLIKQAEKNNLQQIQNLAKQLEELQKENKAYRLKLANMEERIQKLQGNVRSCERYASETVWAEIFNNVVSDTSWLKNTAFSAGRWAVGYQYLYVMYRVLNEIRPQHILELGLGQSTRMIGQYVASQADAEHFVVEHDPEWIDFFSRDFALCNRSKIVKLDREMIPFREAEAVRVFRGFEEQFKGQKFDFISIDAPLGGDMKQYARIDVLKMLPDCLADSFIIMIDDTERSGETNTVNAMKEQLKQNNITFATGRYSGSKDCIVICSEDLKFVCSM